VYDKWHETELERWLSDHGIPHPAPSDRKALQKTVQDNWNDRIVTPYNSWDAQSLSNYLTAKGQQAKKGTEKDAKSLAEQVKVYWTETEDSANQAYGSVKEWIFDSYVSHLPSDIKCTNPLQLVRLSAQGFRRQERYSRPPAPPA
jgi:hypothetical protein